MTGDGLFIDGKVGAEPLRFYFDTGTSGTVWPASFRFAGRETGETGLALFTTGVGARQRWIILPEVSVGSFRFLDSPTCAVEPLDGATGDERSLSNGDTRAIDAAGVRNFILGMGTLQAVPFTIDLRGKELVLQGPAPASSYRFAPHVRQGPVPIVQATVAGVRANLMIDSGVSGTGSRALLISPGLAKRLPIKPTARANFNNGPTVVPSADAFPKIEWSIGKVRGSAPAVVLPGPIEGTPGRVSGPIEIDGLIGSELFHRARITIDARAGTVTLGPYDTADRSQTVPMLVKADLRD